MGGRKKEENVGAVGTDADSDDVGVELGDKVGESDVEEGDGGRRGFLGGGERWEGRGARERTGKWGEEWKVRFGIRNRGFLGGNKGWSRRVLLISMGVSTMS